ncbi:MAG: PLP-dependent aminotransferase family protein [Verrucomicrobiota bacterium]|nr:PLP-dependent aminotransferase family protein [Verrucomicrobiota bacterium]
MVNTSAGQLRYSDLGERLRAPMITRLMNDTLSRAGLISLAAGFTAPETLPVPEVAVAVADLLKQQNAAEFLQYGMNAGRPGLRQAVIDRLRNMPGETGVDGLSARNVMLTTGSQQALYLAMQVLCSPGDRVLVEAPSYFVFLELLAGLGVEPVSIPVLADGSTDLEGLKELLHTWRARGELARLKAVYIGTYYANPSSRCWPSAEKAALGGLLRELSPCPVVLEDAAYRELYYKDFHAAPSVFSLPEYNGLPVLYCGTFTKSLATGLKVGYAVCNHQPLLDKLLHLKGHHDFGSAHFNQAIVEHIVASGEYDRLLARTRAYYQRKMEAFDTALNRAGLRAAGWQWASPLGGLLLWARAPRGMQTSFDSPFYNACLAANILYVPGDLCFANGHPHDCIRLSIGGVKEAQMDEAASALVRATRSVAD